MMHIPRTSLSSLRLALLFSCLLRLIAQGDGTPPWIHSITGLSNDDRHGFGPFELKVVVAEGSHLVGSAIYREKVRQSPVKIDGTQTSDGRFWPHVVAEVTNDLDGEWKTLKQQPPSPGTPTTIILEFYEANVMLYLDLDAFRPRIDDMRYGRVALSTGEAAVFELKELLPRNHSPGANASTDWDRRTLFGYLENPLATGPFVIGGVGFREGRLFVMGGYSDPEATSATAIEGGIMEDTVTGKEEFWAAAVLQVSNDPEGEWKTVGEATTVGKPTKITVQPKQSLREMWNVDVGILRALVGKFGYGRTVLSNGKSAAFELADLLPPKDL